MRFKKSKKGQFSISTDTIMGFMFMIVVAFFIMHVKTSDYIFTKEVDDANNKSIGPLYLYQILSCKHIISLDDGGNRNKFIINYTNIATGAEFKLNVEKCIGTGLNWAIEIYILDPAKLSGKYVMQRCNIPYLNNCEADANGIGNGVSFFKEDEKITKIVNIQYNNNIYLAKMIYGFRP